MALLPCRECRKEVSTEAFVCPHCGAPMPTAAHWTGHGIDWRSETEIFGIPLVHVALGTDRRGKRRVAKGIIAIGQFGIGLITIAQVGIGLLFGFGQFMLGLTVIAQFAGGALVGVGQFATGYFVLGQIVFGVYGVAQTGYALYLWSPLHTDPEVVEPVREIIRWIMGVIGLNANMMSDAGLSPASSEGIATDGCLAATIRRGLESC